MQKSPVLAVLHVLLTLVDRRSPQLASVNSEAPFHFQMIKNHFCNSEDDNLPTRLL